MSTDALPAPTYTLSFEHSTTPVVITLTSGGISPSSTHTRPFESVDFATEGEGAPTSVTVTSNDPSVPSAALFGGDSSVYAVPSTQMVQYWAHRGVGLRKDVIFTLTALGHTAQIVNAGGGGDPGVPDPNHVGK